MGFQKSLFSCIRDEAHVGVYRNIFKQTILCGVGMGVGQPDAAIEFGGLVARDLAIILHYVEYAVLDAYS